MFFKPAFVAAAIATLAVATPAQRRTDGAQCSTGPVQCCQSVQDAKSAAASGILAALGIVVQDITGLVGITCSPLTVIGAGGASCNAQTVCCDNTSFNGIVNLGCSPININL